MHSDPRREIIGNRDVLREGYDPETIRHRAAEIDALSTLLSPTKVGGITETALLYGPPGSGKTCTTTAVLEEIENEHGVPTVAVNCWDDHTKSRVLYSVLKSLVGQTAYDQERTAASTLLDAVKDAIDEPTIIFLDEADKLVDEGVLRDLYEIEPVRLLLAGNDRHRVVGNLEHRVYSRIGTAQDVEFEKYHDGQLVEILEDRLTAAKVKPDIVSDEALAGIADAGSRDARKAIATLRNALDIVVLEGADEVTGPIIERAEQKAEQDIAHARISSLTASQTLVLKVLFDIGASTSGTIYDEYEQRIDDPAVDRTVRGWLTTKFPQYNLVTIREEENPQEYELTDAARAILE
ncbi:Cdc6/Cdc18 family protein [Natrinema pallidum]|nr:AAA family ATPase [Natrinema pallidum]